MKNLDILGGSGSLLYLNKHGFLVNQEEATVVDNFFSPFRPIYVSELVNKLNQRYWHAPIRRTVRDDGSVLAMSSCNTISNSSGVLDMSDKGTVFRQESNFQSTPDFTQFKNIVQIFNNMQESNSVYLFSSSQYSVDILNNSMTLDLVQPEQYTNMVNVSNILQKGGSSDIDIIIELSISYSISGKVYCKSVTFPLLLVEGSDNIENNFLNSGKIHVEYIDGIIRVIPGDTSIDECIISNCLITYGNI